MTKNEAIDYLEDKYIHMSSWFGNAEDALKNNEAIRIAVEALKNDREIIECKNCKHWMPGLIYYTDEMKPPRCNIQKSTWDAYHADHYCKWGEKKNERSGSN